MSELRLPTHLVIGGERVAGEGAELAIIDPASAQSVGIFRGASPSQIDAAVRSARQAFVGDAAWADPVVRSRCLAKLADLIERHGDELMALMQREMGTPISLRHNQVGYPVDFLRWYAQRVLEPRDRDLGDNRSGTARSRVALRPVGVVAAITSYNYPLQISIIKLGAAFVAGCTGILLSSPQAPLAVARMGELALEAGFPPGVFNVIAGGPDVGKALCEHPAVDKISFTGSVAVGRRVMAQAVEGLKGVVLELGGKSAAILLPGADYARLALPLHRRYARHAGQGCGSPTRLLVEAARLDEFIAESRKAYAALVVGDPTDPATIVGPLISEAHRARVEAMIAQALAEGGRIVAGGGRPQRPGWYLNPTLIAGLTNQATLARQEAFGPVAVVLTYRTVDEAIAIANDSEMGLRAYLFGDPAECDAIAPRLRVGWVNINGGGGDPRPDAPQCGYNLSGVGVEGGEEGIREFLLTQHLDSAHVGGSRS